MQPHQQFRCLVWGMELYWLPIQTHSDIVTVQNGEDMPQARICQVGPNDFFLFKYIFSIGYIQMNLCK